MKLFKVQISYEAVVMAEDTFDAQDFADDIIDTETSTIDVTPINLRTPVLPFGWFLHTFLYHNGKNDLTVGQAIDDLIDFDKSHEAPSMLIPGIQ